MEVTQREVQNLMLAFYSILESMPAGYDKEEIRMYRDETVKLLGYWICPKCEMAKKGDPTESGDCLACSEEANEMFKEEL